MNNVKKTEHLVRRDVPFKVMNHENVAKVEINQQVNMGNIHFKTGQYNKAIKYYRMALDQVGLR